MRKINKILFDKIVANDLAGVKKLISAGAKASVHDKYNESGLMLAVFNNSYKLVKLLLENGAKKIMHLNCKSGNNVYTYVHSDKIKNLLLEF